MQVVYEKSILEKIDDAIIEAKKSNKKIEKFVLTRKEWRELYEHFCDYPIKTLNHTVDGIKIQGIKVEVVDS